MEDIDTILSWPLEITYLSLYLGKLEIVCKTNPGYHDYTFKLSDINSIELRNEIQYLTGQTLVDTGERVEIFHGSEHIAIAYNSKIL